MEREAAQRVAELNRPLFGCTARPSSDMPGQELLVGVPEINDPDTGQRLDAAAAARVVQRAAGMNKHFALKRLPAKIALRDILDAVPAAGGLLVPWAVGETALQPVSLDLRSSPHFLAVGLKECGKDELLVTLGHSVMSRFTPDEVRITVIDPKANLTGRIDGKHVDKYCYEARDIAETLAALAAQLKTRLPQAGLSQAELMERARRGFDGPRHVLIINDAHMLGPQDQFADPPTAPIVELITRGSEIGLHVFAARHTGNWDSVWMMDSLVVQMRNARAPILFMDNDGDTCKIAGHIRSQHLPPGRGILLSEESREGVLVGLHE